MNRRDFLLSNIFLFSAYKSIHSMFDVDKMFNKHNLSPAKKKIDSLVFLFMTGGPSQIELFDYKPELVKKDGTYFDNFYSEKGQKGGHLLKPISTFKQYGETGSWFSNLVPCLAKHSDDLLFLKGVQSNSQNHILAQLDAMTGSVIPKQQPFVGSWLSYALGKNKSLPDSFLFEDVNGKPIAGSDLWYHGGIPSRLKHIVLPGECLESLEKRYSNFGFDNLDDEVLFLKYFREVNDRSRLGIERKLRERSQVFDMAFKTKNVILDILKNIKYDSRVKELYGVSASGENIYADQLILTIELLKKGVAYVQVFNGSNNDDDKSWDHHFDLHQIINRSKMMDRATAGFLSHLKLEGLDRRTLVLWGGEFGRTPLADEDPGGDPPNFGRNHNHLANTVWMFGGGIKKRGDFGATDEIGLEAIDGVIQYGDIWATILYLFGINHEELFFMKGGKKVSLTKSKDSIIREII